MPGLTLVCAWPEACRLPCGLCPKRTNEPFFLACVLGPNLPSAVFLSRAFLQTAQGLEGVTSHRSEFSLASPLLSSPLASPPLRPVISLGILKLTVIYMNPLASIMLIIYRLEHLSIQIRRFTLRIIKCLLKKRKEKKRKEKFYLFPHDVTLLFSLKGF